MIQFQILTGKQAGAHWKARRFPVRIGRAAANDLQLEEAGVWDQHCVVDLDRAEGFILTAQSDALLTVNREPTRRIRLRNGDQIELGAARLQFWLRESPQRSQWFHESLVWTMVISVCVVQIALVYWLLR